MGDINVNGLNRRQFNTLLGAAGTGLLTGAGANTLDSAREWSGLFKLGLMTWTLHMPLWKGEIKAHEVPDLARREFGIDSLEWGAKTFQPLFNGPETMFQVPSPSFLNGLRQAADDAEVRIDVLSVGGPFCLGNVDAAGQREALDFFLQYVEPTNILGCHSMRCEVYTNATAGPDRYRRALDATVSGLERLLVATNGSGLTILVENHHGISSNPQWLLEVVTTVNDSRLGISADTNNFRIDQHMPYDRDFDSLPQYVDRYEGLEILAPHARWVSAKTYAFDGTGYEVSLDYPRILNILLTAGYRGYLSIEYEGAGDPVAGVKHSVDMFNRLRAHLERQA